MKIYPKIVFITFIFLFFLNPSFTYAKKEVGKAAIVIDYETNEVLISVNADTPNYPASLTKIMTLYIVFDYLKKNKLNWDTKMKVSSVAEGRSPSKLFLKQGYYDYMYALKDTIENKIDINFIEGSHYETINDYYIYVYYKSKVNRYTKLIGFHKISEKKLF